MRVLVVHNRHRAALASEQNLAVDYDVQLLREAQVKVELLANTSDDINLRHPHALMTSALGPVYSRPGASWLKHAIKAQRPDVVHVHNVNPLFSPWVVKVAQSAGIPVVASIGDYGLDCVNGDYFRDGQVCTKCAGRALATPALRHGCSPGSSAQTLSLVVGRSAHRSTWRSVDAFVVPTAFHAKFLERLDIDVERIHLRPNPVEDPGTPTKPGDTVVFAGRLDAASGAALLVEAWEKGAGENGLMLRILGDGPDAAALRERAADVFGVDVVTGMEPAAVRAAIGRSAFVAVPSQSFNGFPRVVAEAFAAGRAVMASPIGALPAVVGADAGWLVPGGVQVWARTIRELDGDEIRQQGNAARARYDEHLTPKAATEHLIEIYEGLTPSES